jgi:hypothetical protein
VENAGRRGREEGVGWGTVEREEEMGVGKEWKGFLKFPLTFFECVNRELVYTLYLIRSA